MKNVLILIIGGSLGTLSRHGLGYLMHALLGQRFAWGTLTVNLIGSFIIGLLWALSEHKQLLTAETRLLIITGFCGAFTTFSTFMFESVQFVRISNDYLMAGANIFISILLGVGMVVLGMALGEWM